MNLSHYGQDVWTQLDMVALEQEGVALFDLICCVCIWCTCLIITISFCVSQMGKAGCGHNRWLLYGNTAPVRNIYLGVAITDGHYMGIQRLAVTYTWVWP